MSMVIFNQQNCGADFAIMDGVLYNFWTPVVVAVLKCPRSCCQGEAVVSTIGGMSWVGPWEHTAVLEFGGLQYKLG